jgi:hypothetical protein
LIGTCFPNVFTASSGIVAVPSGVIVESVPKRTLGRDGQKPSKSGKQKVHFLQGSGALLVVWPKTLVYGHQLASHHEWLQFCA